MPSGSPVRDLPAPLGRIDEETTSNIGIIEGVKPPISSLIQFYSGGDQEP